MAFLKPEDYYQRVRLGQLTSMNFLIENGDRKFVVARRINAPARGFLFVPGGTATKDEPIAYATRRISRGSLGAQYEISDFTFLGIGEEMYPDNFIDNKFGTHYWALTLYRRQQKNDPSIRVDDSTDPQWLTIPEIMKSQEVHPYTKRLFEKGSPSEIAPSILI